jgi:peptide/nickel transport system permease protein
MFLRRRRAVAALAVLVLFFYAAVWAPLLATDLPLRFRGADRGVAEKAWRLSHLECASLGRALGAPGGIAREKAEASFDVVGTQLSRLRDAVEEAPAARVEEALRSLAAVREAWAARAPARGGAPPGPDPEAAKALRGAAALLKADLDPARTPLRVETRWPAFRALDGTDAGLLVLSLSSLAALLLLRKGRDGRRRFRGAAAVALAPALAAAVLWGALAGSGGDSTDYRGGIASGKVVAESVTWAPVPWGLNQNDLESVAKAPGEGHLLGTDESGRDLLCRLLWGARISLSVGFVAVGIYILIGTVVGAVAGFYGRWIDIGISRFIEWVICFPTFFLILVISAFLQERTIAGWEPPQLLVIMVVIGVTGWPGVARLVRAEFLRLVGQDFVVAARALGAREGRLMFRHLLPNALAPVFVAATFGIAGAILTESALSFLGLGITVPRPSWGGMLYAAHGYEQVSTWIFLWPGLAIFLVITCYNLVGEALRDALDPRLRQ